MISLNNLNKAFAGNPVLKDISYRIPRNTIWGIVGPNGAGKTTLFKCLSGLLKPDSGHCYLDDRELKFKNTTCFSWIGYLLEGNPLPLYWTVAEYLHFRYRLKQMPGNTVRWDVEEVLNIFSLNSVRHLPMGELSQGFQRRVGLAECILGSPDLLLLDEPSNGLDPDQIIELRHILAELKSDTTILLSSHYLSELETVCDGLIFMKDGQVKTYGTKNELSAQFNTGHCIEFEFQMLSERITSELTRSFGSLLSNRGSKFILSPTDADTVEDIIQKLNQIIAPPEVCLKYLNVKSHNLEEIYRKIMNE